MILKTVYHWFDIVILQLARQLRWSFLPPLMVYFAAGISGLTAIVGTFFVKDNLGLSAAFLSGLSFWIGIPWALKMPLGHLVDLIWRWKNLLVVLGAALIATSLVIMYGLITNPAKLAQYMSVEGWYVLSALLAPCGYVIQDSVADAMSVEAVPRFDLEGNPIEEAVSKQLHTTMQTLGRISLIGGTVAVASLNIFMFAGVEQMSAARKTEIYASIYLIALVIPLISVSGVLLAEIQKRYRARKLLDSQLEQSVLNTDDEATKRHSKANHWYFTGGVAFAIMTLAIGLSGFRFAQELVFTGSMIIVTILMGQLLRELDPAKARALVGTALIIFVFRAVPLPGPGATWFEIDELGFDQQFLSVLYLITSILTLVGMLLLRPLIATRPITFIILVLSVAAGVLSLPNIGLYFGVHNWTSALTNGVVDARFIAIMDTAVESPLGQIAMIPMLAWIARNAPNHLKATFFAVMASFTNLALSASALLTKYLNQIFTVTREVRNRETGLIEIAADYSELGWILLIAASLVVILPLATIAIVQMSALRTQD